jgi:hypothetical protein
VGETTRFDAADYLDSQERQVAYITAALETGDADFVRDALPPARQRYPSRRPANPIVVPSASGANSASSWKMPLMPWRSLKWKDDGPHHIVSLGIAIPVVEALLVGDRSGVQIDELQNVYRSSADCLLFRVSEKPSAGAAHVVVKKIHECPPLARSRQ